MKVNLKADDYYSQRNNTVNPFEACMPTSRVMWYCGERIPWTAPQGEQPEDYFMELLSGEAARKFCTEKYPWSVNVPPNEVHGMYGSWLDPHVTGARRSDFRIDLKWQDYIDLIDSGHVIMTAGAFPTTKGHAVCVIGYEDAATLILADPYGDYTTDYKSPNGYGVRMIRPDFERIINGNEAGKWGHVPIDWKAE